MGMEATLQGDTPLRVQTREVTDHSFTTFIVERGMNELRVFIDPPEYAAFAEGLLRAGMKFLRLVQEREKRECTTIAPDS